jgi:hypothetical protein
MIPYGLSHLSAHHPYNKYFVYATIGKHSHHASSSYSSRPSVTRRFEDMMASFTMIGSPLASIKNKKIAGTTNLVLAFEGGFMFYLGN